MDHLHGYGLPVFEDSQLGLPQCSNNVRRVLDHVSTQILRLMGHIRILDDASPLKRYINKSYVLAIGHISPYLRPSRKNK